MPAMPRIPGKPKKIAYKILGVPANIKDKKTVVSKKINKRLIYEDTRLVR